MADKFKWCFIGAGVLANRVAKLITESGKHEIISVFTRRSENAREFANLFHCTPCDDPVTAITMDGVQCVYIVTPHNTHYTYTKLALEAGKPVLCEKPFATDSRSAEELFSLAAEKGLYLAEAMWTWFSPVANRIKKWLDNSEFGTLESTVFHYHMDVRNYGRRLTDPNRAGGALLDTGIYPISYIYRLFGMPSCVSCTGRIENGIDLSEDITFRFPDGKSYSASVSMCDSEGGILLSIRGSKAHLECTSFHSATESVLVRYDGTTETVSCDNGYVNEFDLVAGEILAGLTESRYVPRSATINTLRILDECRRQMHLVYPFEN